MGGGSEGGIRRHEAERIEIENQGPISLRPKAPQFCVRMEAHPRRPRLRHLLPLLLLIVGSPAHAQNPYQWVGATSVSFTGDGNGLGFVGMTTQCRADFGPGARMCKSEEIMDSDTLNLNGIPEQGCWVRPSWRSGASALDESGAESTGTMMSCGGWTRSTGATSGLVLLPGGGLNTVVPVGPADEVVPVLCSTARPVACCKPFPVAEPQASMMLPTGVGVLAMLSMMKGGA